MAQQSQDAMVEDQKSPPPAPPSVMSQDSRASDEMVISPASSAMASVSAAPVSAAVPPPQPVVPPQPLIPAPAPTTSAAASSNINISVLTTSSSSNKNKKRKKRKKKRRKKKTTTSSAAGTDNKWFKELKQRKRKTRHGKILSAAHAKVDDVADGFIYKAKPITITDKRKKKPKPSTTTSLSSTSTTTSSSSASTTTSFLSASTLSSLSSPSTTTSMNIVRAGGATQRQMRKSNKSSAASNKLRLSRGSGSRLSHDEADDDDEATDDDEYNYFNRDNDDNDDYDDDDYDDDDDDGTSSESEYETDYSDDDDDDDDEDDDDDFKASELVTAGMTPQASTRPAAANSRQASQVSTASSIVLQHRYNTYFTAREVKQICYPPYLWMDYGLWLREKGNPKHQIAKISMIPSEERDAIIGLEGLLIKWDVAGHYERGNGHLAGNYHKFFTETATQCSSSLWKDLNKKHQDYEWYKQRPAICDRPFDSTGLQRLCQVGIVVVNRFDLDELNSEINQLTSGNNNSNNNNNDDNNTLNKPLTKSASAGFSSLAKTNGNIRLKSHSDPDMLHSYQNPELSWHFRSIDIPGYAKAHAPGNINGLPRNPLNNMANFTFQFMREILPYCGLTDAFRAFVAHIISVKLCIFFYCDFAFYSSHAFKANLRDKASVVLTALSACYIQMECRFPLNQKTSINWKGKDYYYNNLVNSRGRYLNIENYVIKNKDFWPYLEIQQLRYKKLYVDFVCWVITHSIYCTPFDPPTAAIVTIAGLCSMDVFCNPSRYNHTQSPAPAALPYQQIEWLKAKAIRSWSKLKRNIIPWDKLGYTLQLHEQTMADTDSNHGKPFYYLLLRCEDELNQGYITTWTMSKAKQQKEAQQKAKAAATQSAFGPSTAGFPGSAAQLTQNDNDDYVTSLLKRNNNNFQPGSTLHGHQSHSPSALQSTYYTPHYQQRIDSKQNDNDSHYTSHFQSASQLVSGATGQAGGTGKGRGRGQAGGGGQAAARGQARGRGKGRGRGRGSVHTADPTTKREMDDDEDDNMNDKNKNKKSSFNPYDEFYKGMDEHNK